MSKRWLTWGGMLAALLLAVPARAELPKDMDELKARHEEVGKDPKEFCKLWMDACYVYMDEETRDAGREMIQYLTIPLKDDPNWDADQSNQYFVRALKDKQYIMYSYAKGTSPENQYKCDPQNYELAVTRVNMNPAGVETRGIQVYLDSSGADTDRPVYLKKSTKSGLYYMNVHLNVYTDIRPPKDPDKEEFE